VLHEEELPVEEREVWIVVEEGEEEVWEEVEVEGEEESNQTKNEIRFEKCSFFCSLFLSLFFLLCVKSYPFHREWKLTRECERRRDSASFIEMH